MPSPPPVPVVNRVRSSAVGSRPEERIAEFQNCFGTDLARLETEFLRYMQTVR